MRQIRECVTCLALVVCLGLTVVASAQAEPVFYTKAAVAGRGEPVRFAFTMGVDFIEEHTSKAKMECKKGEGRGEVTGATSAAGISLVIQECKIAGIELECRNHGVAEIEFNPLAGELGAITTTKPGLRMRGEAGEYAAEFECAGGALAIKWRGSIIGELTGAGGETVEEGTIPASFDTKYSETGGIQKYTKFLGEAEGHQLEAVIKEGASGHEELVAQSAFFVMKSEPGTNLGFTK